MSTGKGQRLTSYGEVVGGSKQQGVERFAAVRYPSREYAARLLKRTARRRNGYVLDLSYGWGGTAQVYRDAGFRVAGVDAHPDSRAQLHMKSERFLAEAGSLKKVIALDWEPYGLVATATIYRTLLENVDKFRLPLLLTVGCNPRNVVYRINEKLDWWLHWRCRWPEPRKRFDQLPQVFERGLDRHAKEHGLTFRVGRSFNDDAMRKIVTVGVLARRR